MKQNLKFAVACPPNFMRGVMSIGGLACLYDNGFTPEMLTGCSAGALAALSCVAWNKKAIRRAAQVWANLKPSSISRARFGDAVFIAAALTGAGLNLVHNKQDTFTRRTLKTAAAVGLPAIALKLMLTQSSFFTSDPLGNVLRRNLDFEEIFDSCVKLAIVSAEHKTGERILHTNFLPGDKDAAKLLAAGLGTSAIPVIFEPRKVDVLETDGARARGDILAIDTIETYTSADKIFVFLFYDLPKEHYDNTVLFNLDHDNELVVRDKLESVLARLPESTTKKLVIFMTDEPPRKVPLHNFKYADLEYLMTLGYGTVEKKLKEMKLI